MVDLRLAKQIRISIGPTEQRRRQRRTCPIKPRLNNELVKRFRVDDMGKARRAEVPAVSADSYVLQVDVRFYRCETDITEPNVGLKKAGQKL
jgi:hypothetical protein